MKRPPFPTIDDVRLKMQETMRILDELAEQKHPLKIRRGRVKGVSDMRDDKQPSEQLSGAGRTYFFDVETTKDDKPYLRITESRKGKGDEWERSSVLVFPEDAEAFAERVAKMTRKLN